MMDVKELLALFNRLYETDPVATTELVDHRVVCNESFLSSDVPFVCSKRGDGVITMGVVGFVNGMAKPGTGYVAAVYDDCKLTGFTIVGAEQ
ncbi:hypothetical protein NPT74_004587 [Salmonella enterica subsp. enterica serovar Techimani]|nr:hypothetical protein [Salmonella enterica subsp. enterica serovar Ank]EDW8957583.1 hypothetical protein [Salmonella enterica subsp. enterica]EJN2805502.1 hypothetical protein [Salmonella enterica]EJN2870974.1 hypothetical protein [Salmonella enterica subsp. enterica serovar Techimani]EBH2789582.1 hypothetical protein [Salmonella enterica subsp. enterica serovar Ank]